VRRYLLFVASNNWDVYFANVLSQNGPLCPSLENKPCKLMYRGLGPLYTTAKDRGHEVVRGLLNLIQRPYHWKVNLNLVWSRAFKCSTRTLYSTGFSYESYLITILLMWPLLYNKLQESKGCESLKCHGHPFHPLWSFRPSSSSVKWSGTAVSAIFTNERF
jgi:hypothetical protein